MTVTLFWLHTHEQTVRQQHFAQSKHHSLCSKHRETVKGREKPRVGNLGNVPRMKVPFEPDMSIPPCI